MSQKPLSHLINNNNSSQLHTLNSAAAANQKQHQVPQMRSERRGSNSNSRKNASGSSSLQRTPTDNTANRMGVEQQPTFSLGYLKDKMQVVTPQPEEKYINVNQINLDNGQFFDLHAVKSLQSINGESPMLIRHNKMSSPRPYNKLTSLMSKLNSSNSDKLLHQKVVPLTTQPSKSNQIMSFQRRIKEQQLHPVEINLADDQVTVEDIIDDESEDTIRDEEEGDIEEGQNDENATEISDRFLIDSATSRDGVNVPLNSMPKLARYHNHKKTQSLDHHGYIPADNIMKKIYDGDPQKPIQNNAINFSKNNRFAVQTGVIDLSSNIFKNTKSFQVATEGNVVFAKHAPVQQPSDVSNSTAGDNFFGSQQVKTTSNVQNQVHRKQSSIGQQQRMQGILAKSPDGQQRPLEGIKPNKMMVMPHHHQFSQPTTTQTTIKTLITERAKQEYLQQQQQKPRFRDRLSQLAQQNKGSIASNNFEDLQQKKQKQKSFQGNQKQNSRSGRQMQSYYGGLLQKQDGNAQQHQQQQRSFYSEEYGGEVEDGEIRASVDDGPLKFQDLQIFGAPADENVGDMTPHKDNKTNLSAAENLSKSQYLSSSFQNSKHSQLKQILSMSLNNNHNNNNGKVAKVNNSNSNANNGVKSGNKIMSTSAIIKKTQFENSNSNNNPATRVIFGKEKMNYTKHHQQQPQPPKKDKKLSMGQQRLGELTPDDPSPTGGPSFQQPVKQSPQVSPSKLSRMINVNTTYAAGKQPQEDDEIGKFPKQVAEFSQKKTVAAKSDGGEGDDLSLMEDENMAVDYSNHNSIQSTQQHTQQQNNCLEPMKLMRKQMIVPTNLPSTSAQNAKIQKVKESPYMKKATFIEEYRKQPQSSLVGTYTGSIIKQEDTPHNLTHNIHSNASNAMKTALKGGEENYEEVSIELTDQINRKLQLSQIQQVMMGGQKSQPMQNNSQSRCSSANIVDAQSSPSITDTNKKQKLNSGLTKYNKSANRLNKQVQQHPSQSTDVVKKIQELKMKQFRESAASIGKNKAKMLPVQKRASDPSARVFLAKRVLKVNKVHTMQFTQQNHSQLTTQNTTSNQQMKSQRSQQRFEQRRSSSPQEESSLSRVLNYNPNTSYRKDHQVQPMKNTALRPQSLLSALNLPGKNNNNNNNNSLKDRKVNSQQSYHQYGSQNNKNNNFKRPRKPLNNLSLPRVFRTLLSFLDFMCLFTMMQTRRDYRWDISTRGKGYQPNYFWVHKEIRKRMKQILLKDGGLRSTVERRNFWIYRSKLEKIKDFYPDKYYLKLVAEHLRESNGPDNRASLSEIGKDIGRTFPDLQFFQKDQPGQLKLHRILTAASMFKVLGEDGKIEVEPVGYTQGMNFIAGTALIHLGQHEENTFWFLISLLCEHEFRQVFNFTSEGTFRMLCFQLEVLTQVYLPDLHEHLTKNSVPTDIYASNWFITMFTNDLPFDMAPSVLDVYLLEGHKGLLRIALSLLSFLKHHLLCLQYDELMVFLSHPNARLPALQDLDQDWLFRTSYTFKITNNLLSQLHRLFIVREKIQQLRTPSQSQKAKNSADPQKTKLSQFSNLQYFSKLQLFVDQNSVRRRHEWHILMLGPDDVDELMCNEGLQTDEIEQLRRFYNQHIKDRGLGAVLEDIEEAIDEPKAENSPLEIEVAVENNIRATNKMTPTNESINQRRAYHQASRKMPSRPFSKASTISPELTARSSSNRNNNDYRDYTNMAPLAINRLIGQNQKPENPDVPDESNLNSERITVQEDIQSNIPSPMSSLLGKKQINLAMFQGSVSTTPKMKSNQLLTRPVRHRNDHQNINLTTTLTKQEEEFQKHSQQMVQETTNAQDESSQLEQFFKPVNLSPKNNISKPNIISATGTYYDSASKKRGQDQTRRPNNHSTVSSKNDYNMSNRSKSVNDKNQIYSDDFSNGGKSPNAQISALRDILFQKKGQALTLPQKAQISDAQNMYYQAPSDKRKTVKNNHKRSQLQQHKQGQRASASQQQRNNNDHHNANIIDNIIDGSSNSSYNYNNPNDYEDDEKSKPQLDSPAQRKSCSVRQNLRQLQEQKMSPEIKRIDSSLLQRVLSPQSSNSHKRQMVPESIVVERRSIGVGGRLNTDVNVVPVTQQHEQHSIFFNRNILQ